MSIYTRENLKKYLKKYLPDILWLLGVGIASYNLLRPPTGRGVFPSRIFVEDFLEYKVIGILLIALSIDIAVRRIVSKRDASSM